mmetsp:Transcript_54587/g.145797  ORF Transcript_54587/g.145797 Transcript_54587/m.145797 type:complete len:539 (+) Transcript_54587:3148-4764(+)
MSLATSPSICFVSFPNSSPPYVETEGTNFFTSIDLEATKVRTSVIAACTATIASSEAHTAFVASATSRNSSPFKYGSSAAETFSNATSTFPSFDCASLTKPSQVTRWVCSWVLILISFNLACEVFAFASRPATASTTGPVEVLAAVSNVFTTSERDACTDLTAASTSLMLSSEGRSSPRGQLWISTFSSSSSTHFNSASFCSNSCLLFHAFSPCRAALLCFPSSACAAFTRPCILEHSFANAVFPALDFCFAVIAFRASAHARAADFSSSKVSSVASLRLSTELSSNETPLNGAAASIVFCSFASASDTNSMTSCINKPVFLDMVSFLKADTAVATASSLDTISCNSAVVFVLVPSLYFDNSAIFALMKVFPSAIAVSTAFAASSLSAMATVASSAGMTSIPFKNGASAAVVFCKSASAVAAFSALFDSIPSNAPRSFCSVKRVLNSSNFFFVSLPRDCICARSSFNCPWAVAAFWSTNLNEPLKLFITRKMAVSAALTSSSLGVSSTMFNTFSTSTSIAPNLFVTTDITFLPSTFCS